MPFEWRNVGSTKPTKVPALLMPPSAKMDPEVERIVDTATGILGGETHRFLFRKLLPRQSIGPHIDKILPEEYDWRRFQLPLITDPKIVMRWPDDGQELHLEAGTLYEVRADRTHEIVNGADVERLHLQIDQVRATV